jgi:hypothetical protein
MLVADPSVSTAAGQYGAAGCCSYDPQAEFGHLPQGERCRNAFGRELKKSRTFFAV